MKKILTIAMAASIIFAACNNEKKDDSAEKKDQAATMETKQERNKKVVMASVEAVNAHNADDVLKNSAADGYDYGDGSMPPIKGIDSIKVAISGFLNAFPDYKGENLIYFADGDYVVVTGDWSGTFKNDFMGIKATGKPFKIKDADIFKLNEEGKITEHHFVQSLNTLFMQVGASMMK